MDTQRFQYCIVLASDGLWNVANFAYLKPSLKVLFSQSDDVHGCQTVSEQVCLKAKDTWNEVRPPSCCYFCIEGKVDY